MYRRMQRTNGKQPLNPQKNPSVEKRKESLSAVPLAKTVRMGRVLLLGTLLIAANAFFGTYAYVVVQALIWTQTSLLRGPLVFLFVLALGNVLCLRFAARFALRQSELLLLYGMLCLGTCAAGYGFVQILINQIASPFYYASDSNRWKSKLWPYIPRWLAPRDPAVLKSFFKGNASLYTPQNLAEWAVPVLAWSAFIFAIFWTLLCVMTLLRRQWVEEERLAFPLTPLPLEMTQEHGPFWRSRAMWIGFTVAGLLESVNYIAFLYPSFPSLPLKPIGPNRIDTLFTHFPLNQAGMVALAFYPFVIGIAYVLSLDISFSCWFCYVLVKFANVATAMAGFSDAGGGGAANRAPYIREQSMGAFLGIALFSVWMARKALARAWQEVKRPTGADRDEVMSYRLAIFGGLVGLLFLVGFLVAAGLAPSLSVTFVFVYFCVAITLARIVSEAGAGWAFAPQWSTTAFAGDLFGMEHFNAQSLTTLHNGLGWTLDMRDNPMPQQAQSLKMGHSAKMSARAFLMPLVWASLFGIFCAFWAHLHIYYAFGAASAKVRPALVSGAPSAARMAEAVIASPTKQDFPGIMGAFFGLLLVLALTALRLRFAWWPVHPLGYALATTGSMDYMWFPFFLAWLAKWLTLRYGGIRAFRAFLPFFLGLILGDYVVPTLWSLFGMFTDTQQYMAFPH